MTAINGGVSVGADVNAPIGQIRPLRVPVWFKAGFRALCAVAPNTAAKAVKKLLFSPPRAVASGEARSVLGRGKRFVLEIDGRQVIGREWGEGPAVLLVHGWGGHSGHMSALVDPLVGAGFRAVAIDMAGHGESEGRLSSMVHFASAIKRASELFGPMPGVVAHSMGAAACTYAMSRGLVFERVVFFAPPARFESQWTRFRTGMGVPPEVWQAMVRSAETWLNERFDSMAPIQYAPLMTAPLLVLHAPDDREMLYEEGVELAGRWPNARLHRAEGRGHLRILSDRECIDKAVGFLKEKK
jgi:pimeloyl-ACP methyl ester carboxylesterase